jgi:hypothetical protein
MRAENGMVLQQLLLLPTQNEPRAPAPRLEATSNFQPQSCRGGTSTSLALLIVAQREHVGTQTAALTIRAVMTNVAADAENLWCTQASIGMEMVVLVVAESYVGV